MIKPIMFLKDWRYLIGLTLISPLLTGYYFGVLDHDHYLPYLNKILNGQLYPNDYYFSQPHGSYSWFNYLVMGMAKILFGNLVWTHLILYGLTLGLFYAAVYYLAKIWYRRTAIAVMAVVFLMLPKWAAQIGYMTHHFYFVSRDLSLALALMALAMVLRQKSAAAWVMIIVALLVNPAIPVPVLLLMLLFQIKNSAAPAWLAINQDWLKIMQERGTYSFPSLWHTAGWGTLIYYFSLLGLAGVVLKHRLFGQYGQTMKRLIIICLGLFAGHWFFSSVYPLPQLIQLQLLRSVNFIFIFALIASAAVVVKLLEEGRLPVKIAAAGAAFSLSFWSLKLTIWHMALAGLLPLTYWLFPKKQPSDKRLAWGLIGLILGLGLIYQLIVIKPVISLPDYWLYPNPLFGREVFGPWREVQAWAKANTPAEAVFLTPPNLSGFRSFSQRGIVADAKDGGVIFYSQEYARLWQERMQALAGYEALTEAELINLRQQYYFDYVVFANPPPIPLDSVFSNEEFTVFKL